MRLIRFRDSETSRLTAGIDRGDGTADAAPGRAGEGIFEKSHSVTPSFLAPDPQPPTGSPPDPGPQPPVPIGPLVAPWDPPAIFGIGLNYRAHAAEQGLSPPERPVVFMKNPAAVCGPFDDIIIPRCCREREQVDFECELGVVIDRDCRDATVENALDFVLGWTAANDVSARWWQKHAGGGQFTRGKSFDTFCPVGPCIVTRDEIPDPGTLRVTTRLNGETMQDSNTSDLIFSVAELIAFLSQGTTLLAGTLILTGTPGGVGFARKPPVFLREGDVVEVEVEGIGTLRNRVVYE